MDFLEAQNYLEKVRSQKGIVLGLDTMRHLMAKLNNPQDKVKFIQVAGQVHKFHQGIRLFNLHSGSEDFPLLFRHALHPSGEEIEFLQTVVCGWFPCQKVRQTIYGGLYIMDFYFRVFLRFLQLGIGFAKFSG